MRKRENEKTIPFWLNPEIWPSEKTAEKDFMKQTPAYNIGSTKILIHLISCVRIVSKKL